MPGVNLIGYQFEKINKFDHKNKKGTVVPLFTMTQAIDSFEAVLGESEGKIVIMYYELSFRSGKTVNVSTESFMGFAKLLNNPVAGKRPDIQVVPGGVAGAVKK